MSRAAVLFLAAATPVLFAAEPARLELASEAPVALTVRIYDYADVPPTVLQPAVREARRVFSRAGVEVRWAVCAGPSRQKSEDCLRVATSLDLRIRILPKSMGWPGRHPFGAAVVPSGRGLGVLASVFWNRVKACAVRRDAPTGLLLGHVVAHEVGHLLLGPDSHHAGGASGDLMAAAWDRELALASRAGLRFREDEARRMQAQIRRRAAAALRPR